MMRACQKNRGIFPIGFKKGGILENTNFLGQLKRKTVKEEEWDGGIMITSFGNRKISGFHLVLKFPSVVFFFTGSS